MISMENVFLNVKIIKRAEREKIRAQIPPSASQAKNGGAQPTEATMVKSWIVELLQNMENERLAVKALFRKNDN